MGNAVNPYAPPQDQLGRPVYANTSGMGGGHPIPEGVAGWSWGAFFLSWIWGIGNKTYIGLLALIPYVGMIVHIWLAIKGREMAWQNKRWDSLEHFNEVQRRWSVWGVILVLGVGVLGIASALAIYGVRSYVQTHR